MNPCGLVQLYVKRIINRDHRNVTPRRSGLHGYAAELPQASDHEARAKKAVRLIISKTTSTGETQYMRKQRGSQVPIRRGSQASGSQVSGSQAARSQSVGSQASGLQEHGRDGEQDQVGRDAGDPDGARSKRASSAGDEILTAIERIKQMDVDTLAGLARALLKPAEAQG